MKVDGGRAVGFEQTERIEQRREPGPVRARALPLRVLTAIFRYLPLSSAIFRYLPTSSAIFH